MDVPKLKKFTVKWDLRCMHLDVMSLHIYRTLQTLNEKIQRRIKFKEKKTFSF